MFHNWIMGNEVTLTGQKIYDIASSFLGSNGSNALINQLSERAKPAAVDLINAAIPIVDEINLGLRSSSITPAYISSLTDNIKLAECVAYSLLPIKLAEMLSIRYDQNCSIFLSKLYDSTYKQYKRAIPAAASATTEVY